MSLTVETRAVLDALREAAALLTRDGRLLYVNAAFERLFGTPASALVGRALALLVPSAPGESPDWTTLGRPRRRKGVHRDGRELGFELTMSELPSELLLAVLRDLPNGQAAPHAAQKSPGQPPHEVEAAREPAPEARLRKETEQRFLSEASQLLLDSLDIEKTLGTVARLTVPTLADWCLIELVDQRREGPEALQPVAFAHVNPERAQRVFELRKSLPPSPDQVWQRVHRSGKPLLLSTISKGALQRLAPDAPTLELLHTLELHSAMVAPLKARGNVLGVLSLVSAESKRRFAQADLAFAIELAHRVSLAVENALLYRQAQDAIRLRDEFLSIASHELRTPLTPLQLHLQHLERLAEAANSGLCDPKVQLSLQRTRRQVDRLIVLAENLLDVTRLQRGRLELQREQVDLAGLVQEVLSRFSDESDRAKSSIALHHEGDATGQWDRLRIEQVLVNLLANALKYGCSKPIDVHVSVSDGSAVLRVVDRGIGIEPGQLERIFGRFERAVSAKEYGGLGLGLYIVQQIVEAHHGTVHAECSPEGGATFVVQLPLDLHEPLDAGGSERAHSDASAQPTAQVH